MTPRMMRIIQACITVKIVLGFIALSCFVYFQLIDLHIIVGVFYSKTIFKVSPSYPITISSVSWCR